MTSPPSTFCGVKGGRVAGRLHCLCARTVHSHRCPKIYRLWKRPGGDFVLRRACRRKGFLRSMHVAAIAWRHPGGQRIGLPDSLHLPQYYGDTDYTCAPARTALRCGMLVTWAEEIAHSGDLTPRGCAADSIASSESIRLSRVGLYWRLACLFAAPLGILRRRHYFAPLSQMAAITLTRMLIPGYASPAYGRRRRRWPSEQ